MEKLFEKRFLIIMTADDMQFCFMHEKGTFDAVFILIKLQEEYCAKDNNMCTCSVDMVKALR